MTYHHRIFPATALAAALGFNAAQAQAQTPPDAGALQQQIERDHSLSLPKRIAPERPAVPTPMKPSGVAVTVREFRFAGNTLMTNEQLARVVAGYRDRPLDFAQLQAAASAVADAYREAGWIVRAYLPAQDIKDGVVTIQVVEAVFGGVRFEGPEPQRLPASRVQAIFDAQQKKGDLLNADALDRAMLLADDLPGVAVSGALREGTRERETDLILKLADEPLVAGQATLDNTGARSTGSARLAANVAVNSPFGFGDLLSADAVHSQGSDYLRLGYAVPVGNDGWRIGANASHLGYRLVASEFSALSAGGSSDTAGLEATYPLVRSRLKNLFLAINLEDKRFDNRSGGATTSSYKADAASIGLTGNLFDNLGGGGANAAGLSLTTGNLNLDGSPNQAADAASTRAAGRYAKLRYTLSRQQVVTDALSGFAQLSGQSASKNLDSSEKFYLGGSGGVRAYPSNEGGGSEGQLLNLELRWRLPEGFALTGFYDWGHVVVNRDNGFAGAAALNAYSLKGHGLALAWSGPAGVNLKATWARRDGNNPNPTAAGNDQDGSLVKNRFWLAASLPF